MSANTRVRVYRIALSGVLVMLWELSARFAVIDPLFLPPPTRIVATILELWRHGSLREHTLLSAARALTGFAVGIVVGPTLGFLLGGWFPRLRIAAGPVLHLFSQANPVVLFHVVILFFGIGETAKVFIIAWLTVWPLAFSAIAGVQNVDTHLFKTARAFGLSRMSLFVRVVLPSAAPSIFTGARLAAGYAFVMLIAAEMMGTSSGLGWFLVQSQESYHVLRIFAAAVVITALALVTDWILAIVERFTVRWQTTPDERRWRRARIHW